MSEGAKTSNLKNLISRYLEDEVVDVYWKRGMLFFNAPNSQPRIIFTRSDQEPTMLSGEDEITLFEQEKGLLI